MLWVLYPWGVTSAITRALCFGILCTEFHCPVREYGQKQALQFVSDIRVRESLMGKVIVFSSIKISSEDGYYPINNIGPLIKNTNMIYPPIIL